MTAIDLAAKGSQRWLQLAVNDSPELLVKELAPSLPLGHGAIEWLSPLRTDSPAFCEYRDDACLQKLRVRLDKRALATFWPSRGPMWDALGRTESGELLLVEAKAHIAEMVSP